VARAKPARLNKREFGFLANLSMNKLELPIDAFPAEVAHLFLFCGLKFFIDPVSYICLDDMLRPNFC